MEKVAPGITKRLSFGDMTENLLAAQQLDVAGIIKALKAPTVDNFQAAINLLQEGAARRSSLIEETAKEQSLSVGEADLRRLKRQFSSLKNTFTHYEVKDEFIAALADGLPNGTEDIQLARFEQEATKNIDTLRVLKARNEQAQTELTSVIAEINETLNEVKSKSALSSTEMARLAQEVGLAAAAESAFPPLPDGLDEAQCHAALAEESAAAHALEARIVASLAEINELQAILPTAREEHEIASAELNDVNARLAAVSGRETEIRSKARFESSAAWAQEALSLLEGLGGVKIMGASPESLEIELSTAYPTIPVVNGVIGSCARGSHRLMVRVHNFKSTITAAELSPPDADVLDIVEAAVTGARGADFLIGEVQSRLGGVLHRKALASEMQERYQGTSVDAASVNVTVPLRRADGTMVHVHMVMDKSWPGGDDVVRILSISGEAIDAEKVGALNGLCLQGQGFAAALEAARRGLEG